MQMLCSYSRVSTSDNVTEERQMMMIGRNERPAKKMLGITQSHEVLGTRSNPSPDNLISLQNKWR